jgi:hypothetical protein
MDQVDLRGAELGITIDPGSLRGAIVTPLSSRTWRACSPTAWESSWRMRDAEALATEEPAQSPIPPIRLLIWPAGQPEAWDGVTAMWRPPSPPPGRHGLRGGWPGLGGQDRQVERYQGVFQVSQPLAVPPADLGAHECRGGAGEGVVGLLGRSSPRLIRPIMSGLVIGLQEPNLHAYGSHVRPRFPR